jgi:hypothetical protein
VAILHHKLGCQAVVRSLSGRCQSWD